MVPICAIDGTPVVLYLRIDNYDGPADPLTLSADPPFLCESIP